MGRGGVAERQQIGVRAMTPEEFRRWFLDTMKTRERQVVNSLVQSKVGDRLSPLMPYGGLPR